MPATRVLQRLRSNGFRWSQDNRFEMWISYQIRGPTDRLACYGATDSVSGLQLPLKGSVYPTNNFLFATDVEIEHAGHKNPEDGDIWEAKVTWQSLGPIQAIVEPLEYQWGQGTINEPITHDRLNRAFINSAGVPLSGNFSRELILPTLRVWVTLPVYNPAVAFSIANHVNSTALNIFGTFSLDVQQMRCLYFVPATKQRLGYPSTRCELAFEFRDGFKPFQPRSVDLGYQGWGNSTRGNFYFESSYEQPGDPLLLDGTGKPLDARYKVGVVDSSGNITLYPPQSNPIAPNPPLVFDTSQAATGTKVIVFDQVATYNFNGILPPIM